MLEGVVLWGMGIVMCLIGILFVGKIGIINEF